MAVTKKKKNIRVRRKRRRKEDQGRDEGKEEDENISVLEDSLWILSVQYTGD